MRPDTPQTLNSALRAILWRRLTLPYLAAMFIVVGLAANYGGQFVAAQQVRYSHSIGYTANSFLYHASQELNFLVMVASTQDQELIKIGINANQGSHGVFDTVYVLDQDRKIIELAPYESRYIGLDMSRRSYFQNIDCASGINFSIPFTSLRTGNPTSYLLHCVDVGGYVVAELNLGALQEAILDAASASDELVFIVDQTGTLLAHPDPDMVARHVNVGNWKIVKDGLKENATSMYWRNGRFWLGSTSRIPLTGWIVVSEVPVSNIYAPYLGALIALVLSLALIYMVSVGNFLSQLHQKLVVPLVHLTESADAFAAGNYSMSRPTADGETSYVEIDRLLFNFQKMSRSIIARESLLKESERQYQSLLEYSPYAILLHRNSIILYANTAAIALYRAKDINDLLDRSILDISHPDSLPMVTLRLQKLSEREQILPVAEQKHLRVDGQAFQAEVVTSSIFFAGDYVAQTIVQDITQRKNEEQALRYRATHDPLTNLPNRFLFQDRLEHALAKARRNKTVGAVLYLDLDSFKSINDAFGHNVGDQVLQYIAAALRASLREEDTVARMGGDEFVILLDVLKDAHEARVVADNILHAFSKPYDVNGGEVNISFSIGISIFPTDGMDINLLLQSSDAAMYSAKEEGKHRIKFYAPYMREQSLERLNIQAQLKHALEQHQFFLKYQPQVHAPSGQMIGVEALLRWKHPQLGMISPEKFIPIAEETGLIIPIGEWVLRTACAQLQQWHEHPIRMAINLSNLQLKQPHLMETVQDALDEFALPPDLLELELTENIVFQNTGTSISELYELKSLGVSLAMDDFGSGFSTLGYLAHIPFDRIKIDQRLVSNVHHPKDAAVVSGIFSICQELGLEVIAEGVETEEQLLFCESKGCQYFQGWYYSRAVDADEITNYFLNGYPWKSSVA